MDGFDNLTYVPVLCGDIDGDAFVATIDIELFVGVLLGLDSDPCHVAASDINADESVDGRDIQPYVNCLLRLDSIP